MLKIFRNKVTQVREDKPIKENIKPLNIGAIDTLTKNKTIDSFFQGITPNIPEVITYKKNPNILELNKVLLPFENPTTTPVERLKWWKVYQKMLNQEKSLVFHVVNMPKDSILNSEAFKKAQIVDMKVYQLNSCQFLDTMLQPGADVKVNSSITFIPPSTKIPKRFDFVGHDEFTNDEINTLSDIESNGLTILPSSELENMPFTTNLGKENASDDIDKKSCEVSGIAQTDTEISNKNDLINITFNNIDSRNISSSELSSVDKLESFSSKTSNEKKSPRSQESPRGRESPRSPESNLSDNYSSPRTGADPTLSPQAEFLSPVNTLKTSFNLPSNSNDTLDDN